MHVTRVHGYDNSRLHWYSSTILISRCTCFCILYLSVLCTSIVFRSIVPKYVRTPVLAHILLLRPLQCMEEDTP